MADKKFKTYCKIIDFVEAVDSELADVIKHLCAEGALTSLKGKPGITFLMPEGAYRTELFKLAYSDKPEEAIRAGDMLNALIIRDVFKSPSEWKEREVVNSLYPYQVVDVASTTASEVTFKSGAKAALDTRFKDSSRPREDKSGKPRSVLAVWKITGGIPVTTDKPASKRSKNEKTGAYDAGRLVDQSLRFKIGLAVENAYAVACSSGKKNNVYFNYTMSLVNHIMNIRKDTALMYEKVLPFLSFDHIDFYLLVEPHRAGGRYLLDDSLIQEWWSAQVPCACDQVMQQVQSLLNAAGGGGAALYANRPLILDEIDKLRVNPTMMASSSKFRETPNAVCALYDNFIETNSVGSVQNVYPQSTIAFYQQEPGLKLIHDELRFVCHSAFAQLEQSTFDYGAFHELTNMIGEYLHANSKEERCAVQQLLNANKMKFTISPSGLIANIIVFINSTMFMYIPLTNAEAAGLKQKNTVSRPKPHDTKIYNIAQATYVRHERLAGRPEANKDLIDAILSIDVSKLDPALVESLRNKFH